MSGAKEHGARVLLPPPLLFAAGFLAGVWLRRAVPGDALPPEIAGRALPAGIALAAAGALLGLWGILTFAMAKTTPIPHKAVSTLVLHGPYRFSRNPMYVGLTAVYLGLALALNRFWPLALLPIVFAILIAAVVRPEERYLESRFGEDYRAYRARVRRFL